MNEQEYADQLGQKIDHLLSGGTFSENDPLLDLANTLAGESLQPPDRSVTHLEQQLDKWFNSPKQAPQKPISRMRLGSTVGILLTVAAGMAIVLLSLALIKDRSGVGPSLVIASPTIASSVQVTSTPTNATSTGPGTTSEPTHSNTPSADDSNDLPITLNVTGEVQNITDTTISVNDLSIAIPSNVIVPVGVEPGVSVTIIANFQNGDMISALAISLGTLPPATTPGLTQTTTVPTTEQAVTTSPSTADCGGPNQPLAVFIATSFNVPYTDVIGWHCKGFGFGEIVRAYLLAQQTSLTVDQVLAMRARGQGWGQIMKASGVNPKDLAPGSTIRVTKGHGNGAKGTPPGKSKGKGDKGN